MSRSGVFDSGIFPKGSSSVSRRPAHIKGSGAAFAKAGRIRTNARSRKHLVGVLHDSNGVPIQACASKSRRFGAAETFGRELRVLQKFDTYHPQCVTIRANNAGGGTMPEDSRSKINGGTGVWYGNGRFIQNTGTTIPFLAAGGVLSWRDSGESNRNFYAIIDKVGDLELAAMTQARILFGYGRNTTGGNNPNVANGTAEIGGTTYSGSAYSPNFVGFTVEVFDATGLTFSSPMSAGEITAANAAATISSISVTNGGTNTFYYTDGNLTDALSLPSALRYGLRFVPGSGGGGTVSAIILEDGATTGVSVIDLGNSGASTNTCRYNQRDAAGNVTATNSNAAVFDYPAARANWIWPYGDAGLTAPGSNHKVLADVCDGGYSLVDMLMMNDISGSRTPAQWIGLAADAAAAIDARTGNDEGLVFVVIPPCPFGSTTGTRDDYFNGFTISSTTYRYSDYQAAAYALMDQYPGTVIAIDLQEMFGNIAPMALKQLIGHSGVFDATSSTALDALHMKHFAFVGPAAEAVGDVFELWAA